MAELNTLPGWKCVRQIGAGSFGKVYEIQHTEYGKVYKAALKVVRIPQDPSDLKRAYSEGMDREGATTYFRSFVENLTDEFAIMDEIKGFTNIVSYEDHMVIEHPDEIAWDILIRMELLTSLPDYCTTHTMSEKQVIQLGMDICNALEICEEKKIIHRDIKPDNIFVNDRGDFKLGDFGIARTVEKTMSGMSKKGTYDYMAPEVYLCRPYGQTVDLYSLGTMLYRFLNKNRLPFLPFGNLRPDDRTNALEQRMSGAMPQPPVNGSEQLKAVVMKSIAFDAKERYQTATEFRQALKDCIPFIVYEGGEDAKPEYSKFSWIAMMFTTSCSAGLIVFGFIETTIYSSTAVPFHAEPFSIEAYEYAAMYTHYHWGLNAWSLYVPASVAVGYMLYNRRQSQISMSSACSPVLKSGCNRLSGCLIDVFGTFGAIAAPVTSMGLGMPLLTLLLQGIFGIPDEYVKPLQIIILAIWVAMFGTSVYLGLQKGIKNLSNINVYLAFAFMLFVGVLAGVFNVLRAEVNALGLYIQNFVHLITYTDPYGDGQFVRTWTVWYWAWLIVYMPLMGVFNARVSKGRTLREIALGQMVWCSLGCWVAMSTLGNYAIKIQTGGIADIASVLQSSGQPAAILAILETMPCPKLMMVIVAILCFVFLSLIHI